ncbi:MAG: hypothetical protein A2Y86_06305 [Candidatus Aminicenantes bacterium RBG_13_62_12]|nr:MAG: hypothetical protein A2Y86_06305 [Candidatus Aminicenantes bacterium RBG_13_62_12]
MPARVLFVSHTAELNGAERMLLEFMRALDRRVFSPFLVTPRAGALRDAAEAAGIPGAVIPMKWWLSRPGSAWKQPLAWLWNVRGVLRLRSLIRSRGIDLVCSNSAAAVGGALAARLAGRPHVWVIHEILSGPRPLLRFFPGNRLLVRLIRRLSRRVVANSSASREAFGPGTDVEVVYNGVILPGGRPKPDVGMKKRLGLGAGDRVAGVIGRIVPEKGQAELIKALALLRGKEKGLKVLFIGEPAERRYGERLRADARRLGVAQDVVFAGAVPDVYAVLPLMTLLVSASRVESFGRTIIEAQACGVPVLAVRTGGVPEVIRHGENGFLVASGRPEALAGALSDFLARDKADVERVVRNARKSVAENFQMKKQAGKLERVFKDVLREERRGG